MWNVFQCCSDEVKLMLTNTSSLFRINSIVSKHTLLKHLDCLTDTADCNYCLWWALKPTKVKAHAGL